MYFFMVFQKGLEEGDIANYIHLQYNHYIDIMRVDGKEKIVMRGLV